MSRYSPNQQIYYYTPCCIEAEKDILTIMCMNSSQIPYIRIRMKKENFVLHQHQILFKSLVDMYENNYEISLLTLHEYLKNRKLYKRIGNGLKEIIDHTIFLPTIHLDGAIYEVKSTYYSRKLEQNMRLRLDHVLQRQIPLKLLIMEISSFATKFASEIQELEDIDKDSANAILDKMIKNKKIVLNIKERIKNNNNILKIKTGLKTIDDIIGGFDKGNLIILGGRPSMGKTTLALNFAKLIVDNYTDAKAIIFSLEMDKDRLISKLIEREAKIPIEQLNTDNTLLDKFKEACDLIRKSKIFIHDESNITVDNIVFKIMSSCGDKFINGNQNKNNFIVIIDYVQIIRAGFTNEQENFNQNESRNQQISEIVRYIKSIAKQFGIIVILLSQLKRIKSDKLLELSDLRDSGSLEQDADIVMILDSGKYEQLSLESPLKNIDLKILKNRNGQIGDAELLFDPTISKFFAVVN
uniref:DNA 5'-3' helicase n=1 Tax=Cyanidium sp. THAL103 TaxID=3027999 RepID=A0A9Y1I467_9RHOD|nr:replication helicase subunit [Cyanidium sp. THAL103]